MYALKPEKRPFPLDISKKQINGGKVQLAALVRKAKKNPLRDGELNEFVLRMVIAHKSPMKNPRGLIRPRNLKSIVVQEAGKGAWQTYFILKSVPVGGAASIESNPDIPFKSKRLALQWAYQIVRRYQMAERLDTVDIDGAILEVIAQEARAVNDIVHFPHPLSPFGSK